MANTRSAEKRNRQSLKRRARNVHARTTMKSAVKKARDAITRGDSSVSQQALKQAARALDKAASQGILHRNTAARKISRLAKAANKATTAAPAK